MYTSHSLQKITSHSILQSIMAENYNRKGAEFMTLENFKNTLKSENIFEKYGIERIGIFGSMARGVDGKDIDILVEDSDYQKWIDIKNELEKKTKIHLDIMLEKYANPIVLMRAKKEIVYVTRYN
ncbi:MAG: nucleotidyltransferase family protein [Fusobacteriaceae bacterium]